MKIDLFGKAQPKGKRRSAAVIVAEPKGVSKAIVSAFQEAGWKVKTATPTRFDDSVDLLVVGFDDVKSYPELATAVHANRLAIDFYCRDEHIKSQSQYPFHLFDNLTVITHDENARRFVQDRIRPVNCRIILLPLELSEPDIAMEPGPGKLYAPSGFEGHGWLEGLTVEFISAPFPYIAPSGSFILIPEFGHDAWGIIRWSIRAGFPIVAPAVAGLMETISDGALLFEEGSEEDFRQKVNILASPLPVKPLGQRLRFGIVAPRYGKDQAGGAESLAGSYAMALANVGHQVEILTTTTSSMIDWNDDLAGGETIEDGIPVCRFALDSCDSSKYRQLCYKLEQYDQITWSEQTELMRHGFRSSQLEEHIKWNSDEYDYLFYLPYLYGTTYWASQMAPEKSFAIPCYHKERYASLDILNQNAKWFAGIFFNTIAEKRLAETELKISNSSTNVVGGCVDTNVEGDADRFREKYGVEGAFLLYAGRFSRDKNLQELLDYFREYKRNANSDVSLIFIGKGDFEIKNDPAIGIKNLGFLPEGDKVDAFAACAAFLLPSTQESFSIVMMEAWVQGRPVIAHAGCPVSREHIYTCGGGMLYGDVVEFAGCIDKLMADRENASAMGARGRDYAINNFGCDKIADKIMAALEKADPRSIAQRLGADAKKLSDKLDLDNTDEFQHWVSSMENGGSRSTGQSVDQQLVSLGNWADISTEYEDTSHRTIGGGIWSRFRASITRHIQKNYIEELERKQNIFNLKTISVLEKLYDEIRRKKQ